MTERVNLNYVPPVGTPKQSPPTRNTEKPENSFQEILEKASGIRFSNHAQSRIEVRNINIEPQRMAQIEDAIDKASEKGSREALLICEDMVFVANVRNRTIITAIDEPSLKDRVFTNIDSAVIIR